MILLTDFIAVADAYGAALGIGRQRVSTIVLNRGATLDLLAAGKVDVGTKTMERALRLMLENWPAQAIWPLPVVVDMKRLAETSVLAVASVKEAAQ